MESLDDFLFGGVEASIISDIRERQPSLIFSKEFKRISPLDKY
jgi:hypothetical protein